MIRAIPISDIAAFLYHRDLTNFRPRNIPRTAGKQSQIVQTMDNVRPVQSFVHDALNQGYFGQQESSTNFDDQGTSIRTPVYTGKVEGESLTVSKARLYESFANFCTGQRNIPSKSVFWKRLKKWLAYRECRPNGVRSITIVSLPAARQNWETKVNEQWSWEDNAKRWND